MARVQPESMRTGVTGDFLHYAKMNISYEIFRKKYIFVQIFCA